MTPEGTTLEGQLSTISSTASDVVPQADMLLLAQPGFAIRSVLSELRDVLRPGIPVQLIPGAVVNLGDGVTIQVTRP